MSYASDGYRRVTITYKGPHKEGENTQTVINAKQTGYGPVTPLYITYEGAMVIISDDTTTIALPVADIDNLKADKNILPRRY